jgi:hypothetical protein
MAAASQCDSGRRSGTDAVIAGDDHDGVCVGDQLGRGRGMEIVLAEDDGIIVGLDVDTTVLTRLLQALAQR